MPNSIVLVRRKHQVGVVAESIVGRPGIHGELSKLIGTFGCCFVACARIIERTLVADSGTVGLFVTANLYVCIAQAVEVLLGMQSQFFGQARFNYLQLNLGGDAT